MPGYAEYALPLDSVTQWPDPEPEPEPEPPPNLWGGLDGLDLANHYAASGPVITGASTGFYVQAWVWLESTAVSATRFIVGLNSSGGANGGWLFVTRTTNAGIEFAAVDAGNVTKLSPQYVVQPSDYGTLMHLVGWKDATSLRLAVNGVEVLNGTTMSGYVPGVSTPLILGARLTNGQSSGGLIRNFGVSGGHYIPTIGEIAQARTDGLAAKNVVAIPGKTDVLYSFKNLGSAVSTIAPTIGTGDLSRTGSPSFVTV